MGNGPGPGSSLAGEINLSPASVVPWRAEKRDAGMLSCLIFKCKPFLWIRIALLAFLTVLLSGWSTCVAIVSFNSCLGVVPQPLVTSLSPDTMPGDTEPVLLIVNGSGFVPQSQIMWNGRPLRTTFADSGHLQTTITRKTFDSFGGEVGSRVEIAVRSQGSSPVLGCPNSRESPTLVLVVN